MDYELSYADTVEEGAALVSRIRRETDRSGNHRLGFDTEFYGVELGKHSVLGRAKVHFASFAWDPGGAKLHPRGFTVPHAAVVSREVVTESAEFRAWVQEAGWTFLAHNAPVDAHTFYNEGLDINVVNTLTIARWTWPGRARAAWGGGGFGLDALGKDVLGEGKTESFRELFSETVEVPEVRWEKYVHCECGACGCRKRSAGHLKSRGQSQVTTTKHVERPVPLEAVVPGHPLFSRALRYAAQDAVLAFALDQVMTRTLKNQEREVPWSVFKAV